MICMFKVIHYYMQMYLKILEINVSKYINLILLTFICTWISMASIFKRTGVEQELLTDMLLIIEKGIRGGICHAIYRYATTNNKCTKNYDKNIELSYLMYLDANNLYGWAMFQKLFVNGFKWKKNTSKFNEIFMKGYEEVSDKEYILEEDVEYPKRLHNLDNVLKKKNKKMKIKKSNKLVCNLNDRNNYVVHIRPLKQALNHGLVLKKCIE